VKEVVRTEILGKELDVNVYPTAVEGWESPAQIVFLPGKKLRVKGFAAGHLAPKFGPPHRNLIILPDDLPDEKLEEYLEHEIQHEKLRHSKIGDPVADVSREAENILILVGPGTPYSQWPKKYVSQFLGGLSKLHDEDEKRLAVLAAMENVGHTSTVPWNKGGLVGPVTKKSLERGDDYSKPLDIRTALDSYMEARRDWMIARRKKRSP